MLGVAALIVVMSVMNGFRHDLMDKMIGLNGHMFLQGVETPLTDYDAVTERVTKVPGVTLALPLVEGQAFALLALWLVGRAGARHSRGGSRSGCPGVGAHITQGTLDGFDAGQGVAIGAKLAEHLSLRIGDKITIIAPAWRGDAVRRHAAHEGLSGRGHLPDRHVDLRRHVHLHAARARRRPSSISTARPT